MKLKRLEIYKCVKVGEDSFYYLENGELYSFECESINRYRIAVTLYLDGIILPECLISYYDDSIHQKRFNGGY